MRTYGGHEWNFEGIADQIARCLKIGGVVVWVVGDKTKDWGETLSSMRQALYFVDNCELKMHDTMIYHKEGMPTDPRQRYYQRWEYMFVMSKGKRKTFNPLKDASASGRKQYNGVDRRGDTLISTRKQWQTGKFAVRGNIWKYDPRNCWGNHPAPFPEQLALDHISSWSNPDDIVLDPFVGSGTTLKAAKELNRHYVGIEVNPQYVRISEKRVAENSQPLLIANQ